MACIGLSSWTSKLSPAYGAVSTSGLVLPSKKGVLFLQSISELVCVCVLLKLPVEENQRLSEDFLELVKPHAAFSLLSSYHTLANMIKNPTYFPSVDAPLS